MFVQEVLAPLHTNRPRSKTARVRLPFSSRLRRSLCSGSGGKRTLCTVVIQPPGLDPHLR
eukprot:2290468-Prorocentrum_lima.AAC.1